MHDRAPTIREFFSPKVFSVRKVAALALLLAIRAILGLPPLTFYFGQNFKVFTFAYITDALAAMYFGPIAAIAFAFVGDFLGFLASSGLGGPYFPGFAISEMVTCFLFACFFYKRKITAPRVIFAWLLNLAIVIIGLNPLWLIIMYGRSAGEAYAFIRIIVNAAQSPLHIFILYWLLTLIRGLNLERYLR